jgi:Protein of unknown function (DUF3987)
MTAKSTPLEEALAYTVATGRCVLFVAKTAKVPLAGSHGQNDASNDVDTIIAMYPAGRPCRWAIRPDPDEVFVDTDPQNGYVEGSVELPPTETYGPTPHRGQHYVYGLNGFDGVHSAANVLKDQGVLGVDFKTESGWVVGYHQHSNGLPRANAPAWVGTAQASTASSNQRFEMPEVIALGAIDDTLMRAAFSYRATGHSEAEIVEFLAVVNRRAPDSTHVRKDFERLARSAASKPRGELPGRITHGATDDTDEDDAVDTALPDFPTDLLPPVMRALVESESKRLKIPAGMIAMPCIVAAAGAIGGARRVRTDDRIKTTSLYGAVVATVGHGKSAGIDIALEPLRSANRVRQQGRLKQLEEQRAWDQAKPSERTETRPPVAAPLCATDTTYESVTAILAQSSRGLFLDPGELNAWVGALDLYRPGGRGADRARYINIHDGREISVERKTTAPIIVLGPVVCILGGLQPALLPALNSTADGLAPRILFVFHPEMQPQHASRVPADAAVLTAWDDAITSLLHLETEDRLLPMTPEALTAWQDGYDRSVDATLAHGHGYVYSKLPDLAARIALVFTVFENLRASVVDAANVERAWKVLLDYFAAHAIAALALAPAQASQHPLVRWLERHGGSSTARDIKRAGVHGIKTDADIERVAAAGMVRIELVPGQHGPPSMRVSLP